jgi:hypothetical protein
MAHPATVLPPAVGAEPIHRRRDRRRDAAIGVGLWVVLVAAAVWWGRAAVVGRGLGVDAAPLVGRWRWHGTAALVVPLALAALVVAFGPRVAAQARWRTTVVAAAGTATAWATALAASDGWDRVTQPLTTRHEYEPFAAGIGGAGGFLRHFVERLPGVPVHVAGHPPGAPLVPWALDAIGLRGAGWFAALVLAGWGLAVAAALVTARAVAGEAAARRAAPAVVLLPAAVWAGTSADALFAGVLGAGLALAVAVGRRATQRRLAALAGGVLLGGGLLLTYGGAAMVALAVAVVARTRGVVAAALVATGAAGVLVATAALSGFWWLDGLRATHLAYLDGVAAERPDSYFALAGNPGALALAAGPAVAAGLVVAWRRRQEAAAWLPLAGLAVVTLVDASSLSKGEVERIWLLFVPWLALGAPGDRRQWLLVQGALGVLVQAWLRSKW